MVYRHNLHCDDGEWFYVPDGYYCIDIYSRFIVGRHVGNSLDASVSVEVLKAAIERYGKPEIVNSDQGSQYTSKDWVGCLQSFKTDGSEIKISIDGKGLATDNIWIERFWRTIKRGYVYLHPAENGLNCIVACATTSSTTTTPKGILPTTGYRPVWLTE